MLTSNVLPLLILVRGSRVGLNVELVTYDEIKLDITEWHEFSLRESSSSTDAPRVIDSPAPYQRRSIGEPLLGRIAFLHPLGHREGH